MARGLNDVTVPPAHILHIPHHQLAIGKQLRPPAPQRNLQIIADLLRQQLVRPPGEDLQFVRVKTGHKFLTQELRTYFPSQSRLRARCCWAAETQTARSHNPSRSA